MYEKFEQAKKRIDAWWNNEIIDRPCIQITAPKDKVKQTIPDTEDLNKFWMDVNFVLDRAEKIIESTLYAGEAFPIYFPNFGPDVFSAYLGCELTFAKDTSWAHPIIKDWENPLDLYFDKNNRWWKKTTELTEEAVKRAKGKYFVGLTDIHGGMDSLLALRGPENLCLDLIYHPDEIKKAMKFLENMWFEVYDGLYSIIQRKQKGSTTWLSVYSTGRYYPVSCDFCCMVSTDMFKKFILPELLAEINFLDHSLYHLDGPGAIHHLDTLLEIPKLNGIQWVPGDGNGPMIKWVPLLKKIQNAGKILHLSVEAKEVIPLLKELSSKGIMFSTSVEREEDAKSLISSLYKFI